MSFVLGSSGPGPELDNLQFSARKKLPVGGGGPTHYRPYLRVLTCRFENLYSSYPGEDVREDPELDNSGFGLFEVDTLLHLPMM